MQDIKLTFRKGLLLGFVALALPTLSGCNTVKGAGKDVQNVGEAVEEGADEVGDEMGEIGD